MTLRLFVDGAHLFAAAGRSLGLGPRRAPGRFDVVRLLDVLAALSTESTVQVRWYDGTSGVREVPEHRALSADPRVDLVLEHLTGGQQRHLESLVLRDLIALAGPGPVMLLGDPRRHAVAMQTLSDRGVSVQLVGVAGGERTPADRLWLRRPEIARCLASTRAGRHASATRRRADYVEPRIEATPARVPRG